MKKTRTIEARREQQRQYMQQGKYSARPAGCYSTEAARKAADTRKRKREARLRELEHHESWGALTQAEADELCKIRLSTRQL